MKAFDENRRDAGLVRAVGPLALAASIVNIVIGAGIFDVPSSLAAAIGPYAALAFVACAVAVGAVAICFAEGGSRVPTSGGTYGYIEAAFGQMPAFVAACLLWFSDVLACGGITAALADAAASVGPPPAQTAIRVAVILAAIGGIAYVNLLGVQHGARLINGSTFVKLIPLAVFMAVGAFAVHGANFARPPGSAVAGEGIGHALILALFAFTGMETAVCASGEVRDPTRTIPRALLFAMLVVTGCYVAVQVIAQGILGSALATATVPLADAMARVSPGLRVLMLVGAGVSMFGWISSDILGSPRIMFALSRDGLLPAVLGRLDPRRHTPYVAIGFYAVIAIGLALTGTFRELAILSTLAVAPLYIAACAAAWVLARRGIALAGPPLSFRWLGAAAAIGIASMIFMISLAAAREIAGLAAILGSSAALYAGRTWGPRLLRRA
jgi:amino acid transporter